jgi:hypothetical protein
MQWHAPVFSHTWSNGITSSTAEFGNSTDDPFLCQVEASGKPWVVITDENNSPRLVPDADGFLRHALFRPERTNPGTFCIARLLSATAQNALVT